MTIIIASNAKIIGIKIFVYSFMYFILLEIEINLYWENSYKNSKDQLPGQAFFYLFNMLVYMA